MADRDVVELDPGTPIHRLGVEMPAEDRVSSIFTTAFVSLALAHGIAIDDLVRGTNLDEEMLADPAVELSWESFSQLLRNCSALWSADKMVQLGRGYLQLGLFRPIVDMLHSLGSPVECYRVLFPSGVNPAFPCIEQRCEQIDRENLRIDMKMITGYEFCAEYFLLRKGVLESIPTILGHPSSEVDLFMVPGGVTFEVRIPPLLGRIARARDWLYRLRGFVDPTDHIFETLQIQARRHEVARRRSELLDAQLDDLRVSEERFTHCFHAAPVAMLITRVHDLAVIDVNEKYLSSLGYSREEIMHREPEKIGVWVNSEEHDAANSAAVSEGSIEGLEIQIRHRDGHLIDAILSTKPVDLAGEPCILWQAVDITARKQNERELEKYRNQLEELVEQRTSELERSLESLQQVERLASIGTLAAGVAHQINNPVAAIRAASEFALLSADEPDAAQLCREALETCVEQADRCGKIVHNILRFSRGEAGLRSREDLRQLVMRSCRLVANYAQESGASIEVDEGDEEIPVFVNPIEIEQVLVNVLRNAVESGEEKSRIEIRARRLETGAFVEVRDDGPGIEKEHLPFLFDPFYTTRLERGGTGLGLSVAHGIVTAHGGSIRADTELAQGTAIQIQLPLCDEERDEKRG